MKFKTNAKCAGCSGAILGAVRSRFPNAEWSLDLENIDKVLECNGIPDDPDRAAQPEWEVTPPRCLCAQASET